MLYQPINHHLLKQLKVDTLKEGFCLINQIKYEFSIQT